MSDYAIFIDDEYVAEWTAEAFALSDLVGEEMSNNDKAGTTEKRTIVVYVNPAWCDHSTGECSAGGHEDEDLGYRVIVSQEAKQTHTATVTIDGDGVITGIDP